MDALTWGVVVVSVLLAVAWYLSYSAARLDRLHARVEGALSALDAQLVRRAEATVELANSGALDPASALILAAAASESLEAHNGRVGDDLRHVRVVSMPRSPRGPPAQLRCFGATGL